MSSDKLVIDKFAGKKVYIQKCTGSQHGWNSGCVCHLVDKVVQIRGSIPKRYAGETNYLLEDWPQSVQEREFVIVEDQSLPTVPALSRDERIRKVAEAGDCEAVLRILDGKKSDFVFRDGFGVPYNIN